MSEPESILDEPTLSVGDLAERTGVAAGTLRMWEQRHGFPEPVRLESGHRRYRERDVDAVRRVAQARDRGIRLDRAVAALSEPASVGDSVFGLLRRRHPELATHQMHKRTLHALSRAIEDEFCATTDRGRIFGGFQTAGYFDRAESRWEEIGRLCAGAVVFAETGQEPVRRGHHVRHVPISGDSRTRREWFVITESATLPVVLAAWELAGQAGAVDSERVFEVTWSLDAAVVSDAVRVCGSLARSAGEQLDESPAGLEETSAPVPAPLFMRAMAYVDREQHLRRS